MTNYPTLVKERLSGIIRKMAESPMLFLKNPSKDFTRKRKLSFETVVNLLLMMGGDSLPIELLKYFAFNENTISTSAFVQQRDKILPFAFEFLLHEFTNTNNELRTYRDYRLLAVDGSALNIAHNPKDTDTFFQSTPDSKGFNQLHLNAIFDLCNKLYVDACVQAGRLENEFKALTDMVGRSTISEKTILIADRGYESYNSFAHIEQKSWNYIIRVKDISSNGILSSLNLPDTEFDIDINRILTRKQTKEVKLQPQIYKIMPINSTFDFLDLHENKFYPISFRVVRFKLSEDSYEAIITNLDRNDFTPEEIKLLYHMRWGIETSFRELKYAVGLTNFHSKKVEYITQEIFARMLMYNFCEMITLHVVIKQKPTKHGYQANFTIAIKICKYFFSCKSDISPPNVEALIKKYILPVRKGRSDPRKVKSKSTVSFIYRVA